VQANPDGEVAPQGRDAASQPGVPQAPEDIHRVSSHGMSVQVLQDPIRIAPGEQGHLVLLVRLPGGRTIEKGGQVVIQAKQGPLNLGNAIWDPPAKGKNVYTDVLVIKVPMSVDGKAKYGKHPFSGSLRIRGDFHQMSGEAAGIATADGREADVAAQVPGQAIGGDPNRAEIPFQRAVNVGPPMPKASKGHRKAGGSKAGVIAGTKGDAGQDPAAGGAQAGKGPDDVVPGSGTAHRMTSESDESQAGLPEEAPELADEDKGGIPWWMLSLGLVVLAGLSFMIQAKKA